MINVKVRIRDVGIVEGEFIKSTRTNVHLRNVKLQEGQNVRIAYFKIERKYITGMGRKEDSSTKEGTTNTPVEEKNASSLDVDVSAKTDIHEPDVEDYRKRLDLMKGFLDRTKSGMKTREGKGGALWRDKWKDENVSEGVLAAGRGEDIRIDRGKSKDAPGEFPAFDSKERHQSLKNNGWGRKDSVRGCAGKGGEEEYVHKSWKDSK